MKVDQPVNGILGNRTLHDAKAEEALDVVVNCIAVIKKQTPMNASFGTKKSALENLRKIAKSICGHNSFAGHCLGYWPTELRETVDGIIDYMTAEDIARVVTPEFDRKLVDLERSAESQNSLKGLRLEGRRYAFTGNFELFAEVWNGRETMKKRTTRTRLRSSTSVASQESAIERPQHRSIRLDIASVPKMSK